MQNLVAAAPTIHSPAPLDRILSSKHDFPNGGRQWQRHHRSAFGTRRASVSGAPRFVVSAFFGLGGSKGNSAKATGKGCFSCSGKGAIECKGCKGSGKNKKNGNMFERWKCYDCQGFGLVGCPKCGIGGLTPEQRGER